MNPSQARSFAVASLATLTAGMRPVSRPSHGWLRTIREAFGLPLSAVAQALHVTPQAVREYERSEAADRISLATLRRAADAMGCELVVAVIPKAGRSFAHVAGQHDPDVKHWLAAEHSMALEGQGVGDLPRQ